jgi:hypothetical protein
MNTSAKTMAGRILVLMSLITVLFAAVLVASASPVAAENGNPGVMPAHSTAFGQSYSEWAADWWTWVIEAGGAPIYDPDGSSCAVGQTGKVWFLAGIGPGWEPALPLLRTCEIPTGKAIFFPVQNNAWLSFPDDPYIGYPDYEEPGGEEVVRAGLAAGNNATSGRSATIDGVAVQDLDSYRVASQTFYAQWPGWLYLGPNFDDGWYLLLAPLSEGEHTIAFTGDDGKQDVVYSLTVVDND